jgi:hypothetical protein
MSKQIHASNLTASHRKPGSAGDTHSEAPEALVRRSCNRWTSAGIVVLTLFLYVSSYFATAVATGAGWMEVDTRHRIVWTVYWPISRCAVNERPSGPRFIYHANGWFFKLGLRLQK